MKACYAGSFDLLTNGHMDIIERAARVFDELVVLIMHNPRKNYTFTTEERIAMLEEAIREKGITNAEVIVGSGLTVQYAAGLGCDVMVRGIRAVSDYEFELQTATANMMINDRMETFLMIARPEYSFLSSSMVKEVWHNGGDVSAMVPPSILAAIKKKED